MHSLRLGRVLLGIVATGAFAATAQAQTYPTKPVTIVVPFAAGGLTDVPARALAVELEKRVGQRFIVENRPGGSGVAGASHVVRSEPDGYTLLANALADVQNLHYIPVPYSAVNDFAMIGMIADGPPLVLIVNSKTPYKSVKELVADAKQYPDRITFGTSGPATSPAIALTQLNDQAGTKITGAPYRGSGAAAVAVAGGEVQGSFVFLSQARPLHDDGRVRALAVASPQRFPGWPELPTMNELGFKDFDHRGFVGLAAPAKTPKPVIEILNKHLNEAIHSDSFRKLMEKLGMTVPPKEQNTPAWYTEFMRRETARQAEFAKLAGHAPMPKQ